MSTPISGAGTAIQSTRAESQQVAPIFARLNLHDTLALKGIGSDLKDRITSIPAPEELVLLNRFIVTLTDYFSHDSFSKQREKLSSIGEIREPTLERYISKVKCELINIIKTLTLEEIATLSKIEIPPLFWHIFEIAGMDIFAKEIKTALDYATEDLLRTIIAFQGICISLTKLGFTDTLIQTVFLIPSPAHLRLTLGDALELFIRLDRPDQALKVANSISQEPIQQFAFEHICKYLVLNKMIDKGCEIAMTVANEKIKPLVLRSTANVLIENNYFSKATALIKSISDKEIQQDGLRYMTEILVTKHRFFDEAILIVKHGILIPDIRNHAFKTICTALTDHGRAEEALELEAHLI